MHKSYVWMQVAAQSLPQSVFLVTESFRTSHNGDVGSLPICYQVARRWWWYAVHLNKIVPVFKKQSDGSWAPSIWRNESLGVVWKADFLLLVFFLCNIVFFVTFFYYSLSALLHVFRSRRRVWGDRPDLMRMIQTNRTGSNESEQWGLWGSTIEVWLMDWMIDRLAIATNENEY